MDSLIPLLVVKQNNINAYCTFESVPFFMAMRAGFEYLLGLTLMSVDLVRRALCSATAPVRRREQMTPYWNDALDLF